MIREKNLTRTLTTSVILRLLSVMGAHIHFFHTVNMGAQYLISQSFSNIITIHKIYSKFVLK